MPVQKKYAVALSPSEKVTLRSIIRKGTEKARTITRARVLLFADRGKSDASIASTLDLSLTTPRDIRKRYFTSGLECALTDAPRPGQPEKLSGEEKAEITAIACTDPPDGYGRWTLDLLERAVASTVKKVSRQTVYHVLLASDLKPWREKNVVHSGD